eukprot:9496225-Pyramimonas_sp.AAC.1
MGSACGNGLGQLPAVETLLVLYAIQAMARVKLDQWGVNLDEVFSGGVRWDIVAGALAVSSAILERAGWAAAGFAGAA